MGELSSEAQAAIYGGVAGGIIGGVLAIAGALLGAIVQSQLKKFGKVRGQIVSTGGGSGPAPDEVILRAEVWFYNEKEVSVGIRDIILRYYRRGEVVGTLPLCREGETEIVRALDLPPRTWVKLKAERTGSGEQDRDMQQSSEQEIYWVYASGKEETRKNTGWDEGKLRTLWRKTKMAINAFRRG